MDASSAAISLPAAPMSLSPSKAEAKVMNFVRTRVELLTLLAKNKNEAQMVQPSADALKIVAASLIGIPNISDSCAIELLRLIESAPFTTDNMNTAFGIVNAKISTDTDAAESESSTEKQDNIYFEEYLQECDLYAEIVANQLSTQTQRFKALARIRRRLGLNHCKEELNARIMAAAFHDCFNGVMATLDGMKGYRCLQGFKAFLKTPQLTCLVAK